MPWVKIDDHFDEHHKFQKAGPLAAALWLAGLAYCNRNLTDGRIPRSKANTLWSWTWFDEPNDEGQAREVTLGISSGYAGEDITSEYVIQRLVDAGLWDDHGTHFMVHDYHEYQASKEQVVAEREATRKRVSDWRSKRSKSNGVTNGAINGNVTELVRLPPTPTPTPKDTNASDLGLAVDLDRKSQDLGSVSPKTATPTRWTGLFGQFWKKYPHWKARSHKKPALSAWDAIKPHSTAMFEAIMAGLDAAIASPDWKKSGGEFVPAAEVWIRKAGWDASDGRSPKPTAGEGTNGYDYAAYNAYRTKALEETGRFLSPEEWSRSKGMKC